MARTVITREIGEQIKIAHATGIGLREFARNAKISEGTVLSWAKRNGLTQEIQTARTEATQAGQSDAITPLESVATVLVQRGQRHVVRMAGVTERVLPHLEQMQPRAILKGIHEIEKFDKMARRTFGLNDGSSVGGSLSIDVLTNQAAIRVSVG